MEVNEFIQRVGQVVTVSKHRVLEHCLDRVVVDVEHSLDADDLHKLIALGLRSLTAETGKLSLIFGAASSFEPADPEGGA